MSDASPNGVTGPDPTSAQNPSSAPTPTPAWLVCLLGWIVADGLRLASEASPPGPAPPDAPPDLSHDPARLLRRLPGIGPVRAAALVEARWASGGVPPDLQAIRGIGPATERAIRQALLGPGAADPRALAPSQVVPTAGIAPGATLAGRAPPAALARLGRSRG